MPTTTPGDTTADRPDLHVTSPVMRSVLAASARQREAGPPPRRSSPVRRDPKSLRAAWKRGMLSALAIASLIVTAYLIGSAFVDARAEVLLAAIDPSNPFVSPDVHQVFWWWVVMPLIFSIGLSVWATDVLFERPEDEVPRWVLRLTVPILAISMTGIGLVGLSRSPDWIDQNDIFAQWAEARYGVDLSDMPSYELQKLRQPGVTTAFDIETGQRVSAYTNYQGTILIDPSSNTLPTELPVLED